MPNGPAGGWTSSIVNVHLSGLMSLAAADGTRGMRELDFLSFLSALGILVSLACAREGDALGVVTVIQLFAG